MSIFDGSAMDPVAQLIFSPDPVARFKHEKVHGTQRGLPDDQPVRALMVAVLEDAIACYQGCFFKPSRTKENLFREAEEWINANDDGIFSFDNLCETLGFDPKALKGGLERWKAKQMGTPREERKRLILSKGKCSGREKTRFRA